MLDKLMADFDGILELVNKAPAPLQEMAFKMIMEQWFSANTVPKHVSPPQLLATGTQHTGSTGQRPGWHQAVPYG